MVARTTACVLTAALGLVVIAAGGPAVTAQVASSAASGQSIAPAYEGWQENSDGSFNLVFGYFNRNKAERVDIPVGADNRFEPGDPDQGQPTHFYPRRSRFLFKIRVPADFGDQELVWTLARNGETEKAYGSLLVDYFLDDTVIQNNKGAGGGAGGEYNLTGNLAPALRIEGAPRREVAVGEPLRLAAVATDDGIPKPRMLLSSRRVTPNSTSGFWLAWFVYRGPGSEVNFDPPQTSVWEDMRPASAGGNSNWSYGWKAPPAPADNRWEATATFDEPGTYVLRAWADDGGLMAYEDITVVVAGNAAQDQQ